MSDGTLTELEITDPAEVALYDELRRFLGDGEAACLAVAATRRWVIAADEKRRLRREIFYRLLMRVAPPRRGTRAGPE